jgi:hypothetical protein
MVWALEMGWKALIFMDALRGAKENGTAGWGATAR